MLMAGAEVCREGTSMLAASAFHSAMRAGVESAAGINGMAARTAFLLPWVTFTCKPMRMSWHKSHLDLQFS